MAAPDRHDPDRHDIDTSLLLKTLIAFGKADFLVRMPVDQTGIAGKVNDTLNEIFPVKRPGGERVFTYQQCGRQRRARSVAGVDQIGFGQLGRLDRIRQ